MDKIRLALIAHDDKKADMVAFVMKRLSFFNREDVDVVATGTTGKIINNAGVDKVKRLNSGPLGGDAEIGALVSRGELEGVIFFRDPLGKHPHEPDVQMLMRLCDVKKIPLATNYNSAHMMISYFSTSKK